MTDETTSQEIGMVLSVSRRFVSLRTAGGEILNGTAAAKALDVAVGDRVKFHYRNGFPFITEGVASSRCLFRSYRGKKKKMGANIDCLFLITAADETFNVSSIDRILLAAFDQEIPVTLVVNKSDLGAEPLEPIIEVYRENGVPVISCSAKTGRAISELRLLLDAPDVSVAALSGVSGVGKSSILNALLPAADCKIGDVSWKTGQGRQTTTQPQGYMYPSLENQRVLVVDYPGIQFFGISHIDESVVRASFFEFARYHSACQFIGCTHTHEVTCGVKDAMDDDLIAHWRYDSYVNMLREVRDAKPY